MVGWQKSNPKRKVVRVLIAADSPRTNGRGGDTVLPDAATAAREASRFRTYVSLDSNATVLDAIAAAGRTGARVTIYVDPHNDTRGDLFAAMRQIIAAETGSDFLVPGPRGYRGRLPAARRPGHVPPRRRRTLR
jgi:hypothetical protein